MTDGATNAGQPTAEQAAIGTDGAAPGTPPASTFAAPPSSADERPELAVGAAFAGGFALALLLKRLAR
jgi:hypothetical protein